MNRPSHVVLSRSPISRVDSHRRCNVSARDADLAKERSMAKITWPVGTHWLPISYSPVTIKYPLQNLLLERMFADFRFIDGNTQPGSRVGSYRASCLVDVKTLIDD